MTPAVVMVVGATPSLVRIVKQYAAFNDAIVVEWDPEITPGVTIVELDSLGEVRVDNAVIALSGTFDSPRPLDTAGDE